MYVADAYSTQVIRGEMRDVLSVYDSLAFQLLHDEVDLAKRLKYKVFPSGQPRIFLSYDGQRLFIGKYGDPDVHALRLRVLDSTTFKELAEYEYGRPDCVLMPLRDGRLACISHGLLQLLDPLTGKLIGEIRLPISITATALDASGERLYLVSSYAQVVVVDISRTEPQIIVNQKLLGSQDNWLIGYNHLAVHKTRLYIGVMNDDNRFQCLADVILAFDTKNWNQLGTLKPKDPAFHIAISADDSQLYTINPFKKSLAIFDAATFREIAVMNDLGDTPARIAVPWAR